MGSNQEKYNDAEPVGSMGKNTMFTRTHRRSSACSEGIVVERKRKQCRRSGSDKSSRKSRSRHHTHSIRSENGSSTSRSRSSKGTRRSGRGASSGSSSRRIGHRRHRYHRHHDDHHGEHSKRDHPPELPCWSSSLFDTLKRKKKKNPKGSTTSESSVSERGTHSKTSSSFHRHRLHHHPLPLPDRSMSSSQRVGGGEEDRDAGGHSGGGGVPQTAGVGCTSVVPHVDCLLSQVLDEIHHVLPEISARTVRAEKQRILEEEEDEEERKKKNQRMEEYLNGGQKRGSDGVIDVGMVKAIVKGENEVTREAMAQQVHLWNAQSRSQKEDLRKKCSAMRAVQEATWKRENKVKRAQAIRKEEEEEKEWKAEMTARRMQRLEKESTSKQEGESSLTPLAYPQKGDANGPVSPGLLPSSSSSSKLVHWQQSLVQWMEHHIAEVARLTQQCLSYCETTEKQDDDNKKEKKRSTSRSSLRSGRRNSKSRSHSSSRHSMKKSGTFSHSSSRHRRHHHQRAAAKDNRSERNTFSLSSLKPQGSGGPSSALFPHPTGGVTGKKTISFPPSLSGADRPFSGTIPKCKGSFTVLEEDGHHREEEEVEKANTEVGLLITQHVRLHTARMKEIYFEVAELFNVLAERQQQRRNAEVLREREAAAALEEKEKARLAKAEDHKKKKKKISKKRAQQEQEQQDGGRGKDGTSSEGRRNFPPCAKRSIEEEIIELQKNIKLLTQQQERRKQMSRQEAAQLTVETTHQIRLLQDAIHREKILLRKLKQKEQLSFESFERQLHDAVQRWDMEEAVAERKIQETRSSITTIRAQIKEWMDKQKAERKEDECRQKDKTKLLDAIEAIRAKLHAREAGVKAEEEIVRQQAMEVHQQRAVLVHYLSDAVASLQILVRDVECMREASGKMRDYTQAEKEAVENVLFTVTKTLREIDVQGQRASQRMIHMVKNTNQIVRGVASEEGVFLSTALGAEERAFEDLCRRTSHNKTSTGGAGGTWVVGQ